MIKFQKVSAVFIQHGKMAGNNDFFCGDCAFGCLNLIAEKGKGLGIFIDFQALGDMGGKLQRMKLGLVGKTQRPGNRKRKGQGCSPYCRNLQSIISCHLCFQLRRSLCGINIVVFRFVIKVSSFRQFTIKNQGLLIGLPIHSRPFRAKSFEKLAVNKAMLRGDFCRCPAADTMHDAVLLDQRTVYSRPGHIPGTQKSRQTTAYDQYIRTKVPFQPWKPGHLYIPLPNRIHHITTPFPMIQVFSLYVGRNIRLVFRDL